MPKTLLGLIALAGCCSAEERDPAAETVYHAVSFREEKRNTELGGKG